MSFLCRLYHTKTQISLQILNIELCCLEGFFSSLYSTLSHASTMLFLPFLEGVQLGQIRVIKFSIYHYYKKFNCIRKVLNRLKILHFLSSLIWALLQFDHSSRLIFTAEKLFLRVNKEGYPLPTIF
jgi:hypothetical protein